jgi:hypothetical protein
MILHRALNAADRECCVPKELAVPSDLAEVCFEKRRDQKKANATTSYGVAFMVRNQNL